MQSTTLSHSALALLRRRQARERVDVTDDTRPLYRELAAAGLMIPLHTLTGGDESAYRLTEAGKDLWSLLLCIWAWEQRWVQGEALPTMRHLDCGQVFAPALHCASCRQPADATDVTVSLGPSGDLARAVPVGRNRRRTGSSRADGPGLFPETMALMGSRWSSATSG